LERLIFFGEASLRIAIQNFVAHYHGKRNHQGLGNRLISPKPDPSATRCRTNFPGTVGNERPDVLLPKSFRFVAEGVRPRQNFIRLHVGTRKLSRRPSIFSFRTLRDDRSRQAGLSFLICSKWFIQWNERGSRLTARLLFWNRAARSRLASTRCEILSVN